MIMVSSELKKHQFSEISDNDLLTLFFELKTNVKFSANLNSSSFLMYANPGVTEKFLSSLPVVNEPKIKPPPPSNPPKYKNPNELRH